MLFKIFMFFLLVVNVCASNVLLFGVISTIDPVLMEKKLTPLMRDISKITGKRVIFQTGYDYGDTIRKFADGTFDIGLIGPAPYVKVVEKNKDALEILAGIKNSTQSPFRAVIVSKKGSNIKTYNDLKGKSFAFGSPNSTLSYYVPKYMLIQNNIYDKLEKVRFLQRHDKVAQYVIMGKFAAGGIKQSIASKYSKYLQIIDTSEEMPGFMIVAKKSLSKVLKNRIRYFLLNMRNISSLKKIKATAVGFEKRQDSDYDDLRVIMEKIDNKN